MLRDVSLALTAQLFAPQFLLPLKSCSYYSCYSPPQLSGLKQEHNHIYFAAGCSLGRPQQGQLVSPLLILAWGGLQAGLEGLLTCLAPGREGWDSWGPEQMGLLGHLSKSLYGLSSLVALAWRPDFLRGSSGIQSSAPPERFTRNPISFTNLAFQVL